MARDHSFPDYIPGASLGLCEEFWVRFPLKKRFSCFEKKFENHSPKFNIPYIWRYLLECVVRNFCPKDHFFIDFADSGESAAIFGQLASQWPPCYLMENVEGTLLRNNYIYIASVVSLSLSFSLSQMLVGEKNIHFWNSSAPAVYFHLRPETYFFPLWLTFLWERGKEDL